MSDNIDDIRLYYRTKFSQILDLKKDNNIILNLENGLFSYVFSKIHNNSSFKFTKEYIKTGRKIISNITYTPNSKTVKDNILNNIWEAENIAKMTHEELYPEFYSELKLKQQKKMIKHIPIEEQPDGLIKCRKCKSMKTVYTQAQTRSADEPMTTFVTCLSCDGHFKF